MRKPQFRAATTTRHTITHLMQDKYYLLKLKALNHWFLTNSAGALCEKKQLCMPVTSRIKRNGGTAAAAAVIYHDSGLNRIRNAISRGMSLLQPHIPPNILCL